MYQERCVFRNWLTEYGGVSLKSAEQASNLETWEKVMFDGEIPSSVVPGAGDGGWGWEWRGREGSLSLLLGPQIHE